MLGQVFLLQRLLRTLGAPWWTLVVCHGDFTILDTSTTSWSTWKHHEDSVPILCCHWVMFLEGQKPCLWPWMFPASSSDQIYYITLAKPGYSHRPDANRTCVLYLQVAMTGSHLFVSLPIGKLSRTQLCKFSRSASVDCSFYIYENSIYVWKHNHLQRPSLGATKFEIVNIIESCRFPMVLKHNSHSLDWRAGSFFFSSLTISACTVCPRMWAAAGMLKQVVTETSQPGRPR